MPLHGQPLRSHINSEYGWRIKSDCMEHLASTPPLGPGLVSGTAMPVQPLLRAGPGSETQSLSKLKRAPTGVHCDTVELLESISEMPWHCHVIDLIHDVTVS